MKPRSRLGFPIDNFTINVVAPMESLAAVLDIVFAQHAGSSVGYSFAGYGSKKHEKEMVFHWSEIGKGVILFPVPILAEEAAVFAKRWLETQEYGPQPDIDGDCVQAFRALCDQWGRAGGNDYGMIAIRPEWGLVGK